MPKKEFAFAGNAVEVKGVYFYYLSPEKSPLIPGIKTPFKRVTYHRQEALNRISLNIENGKITALMGKNGSGKTSLIKLITGVRVPQEGEINVFGTHPSKVKERIGMCLGNTSIYYRLSGRENLEYFGKLYRVANLTARIEELAHVLQLEGRLDDVVESYSYGMKAKLALARSMIHSPELLVLDEPTLGIDYQLAVQIREFVRSLKCTVLLTTHYMEEADSLADNVCIIDRGNILEASRRSEILEKYRVNSLAEAYRVITDDKTRKAS